MQPCPRQRGASQRAGLRFGARGLTVLGVLYAGAVMLGGSHHHAAMFSSDAAQHGTEG